MSFEEYDRIYLQWSSRAVEELISRMTQEIENRDALPPVELRPVEQFPESDRPGRSTNDRVYTEDWDSS
jgi:hypothetical protein